jgi:hypothetical protein
MRQDDPHFLFPQIYFGRVDPLDDAEQDAFEEGDGCILSFDPKPSEIPLPKIGLRMHLFSTEEFL